MITAHSTYSSRITLDTLPLPETASQQPFASENIHNPSHSALLPAKIITHHPKAGINPLVDTAAHLFSSMSRLKQLKFCRHFNKLQKEFITEINRFQDSAKAKGYRTEYTLVSRYVLCATLDDIISHTSWGSQGQWDAYQLVTVFNPEAAQQERFFIILERIIKEPALYIDVLELMYICLSLGYQGHYRTLPMGHLSLEKIMDTLYKQIRHHRGDWSRALSPFSTKPKTLLPVKKKSEQAARWLFLIGSVIGILFIFMGLGYMLDKLSDQAYLALAHIGKWYAA